MCESVTYPTVIPKSKTRWRSGGSVAAADGGSFNNNWFTKLVLHTGIVVVVVVVRVVGLEEEQANRSNE